MRNRSLHPFERPTKSRGAVLRKRRRLLYADGTMRTKLGDYIRDARERLGALLDGEPWRQEDLAELLGVQKSTVFKWEQGQRTASQADLNHIDRCIRLAELGIDPRTVRAADAMELAREQADPVMRGFPKGRSRLVS